VNRFNQIEKLCTEAFELNKKSNAKGACDKWLEAWIYIKEIFAEGLATDIYDLNEKHKWKEYPSNHMQYLEMELHNAGIDDNTYHQKRIDYCKELIQWSGADELLVNNARIAIGEAHYDLGDEPGGEKIFKDWIQEDPDSGWAYGGWADCLRLHGLEQYGKAEEVLLAGYARSELRDRKYIIEGLVNLYNDLGKSDKVKEFQKVYAGLQPVEPEGSDYDKSEPLRVEKIGRNEPCPCGSGKKYKKCCMP
jgi:tetratricopeptide (TPR) repeat protein